MDSRLKGTLIFVALLAGTFHVCDSWSLQADIQAGRKRFVSLAELSQSPPKPCFGGIGQETCSTAPRLVAAPHEAGPAEPLPSCEPLAAVPTRDADSKTLLRFIRAGVGDMEPIAIAYALS